jgi:hypothetical protein
MEVLGLGGFYEDGAVIRIWLSIVFSIPRREPYYRPAQHYHDIHYLT